jgi:hypothetical protein
LLTVPRSYQPFCMLSVRHSSSSPFSRQRPSRQWWLSSSRTLNLHWTRYSTRIGTHVHSLTRSHGRGACRSRRRKPHGWQV